MAGYFMCSKIEEMVTIALPRVSNPPIRLKKGTVHRQTALKDVIRELACFAHLLRTSGSGLSLVTWEFAGGPQPAEEASLTLSGSSVELPGGTTTGPTGKRGAPGHFCSCRLVVLASWHPSLTVDIRDRLLETQALVREYKVAEVCPWWLFIGALGDNGLRLYKLRRHFISGTGSWRVMPCDYLTLQCCDCRISFISVIRLWCEPTLPIERQSHFSPL